MEGLPLAQGPRTALRDSQRLKSSTRIGHLRLALPAELARHHTIRNFSTLYWQSRNQEIFVRSYLSPEEMVVFGFAGVKIPRNINEPLNSEVRMDAEVWRYGALTFIRALEAAHFAFLSKQENN